MVAPAARRRVVHNWVERGLVSERCGSRLMNVSRSVVRYENVAKEDGMLPQRSLKQPCQHSLWLGNKGFVVNERDVLVS